MLEYLFFLCLFSKFTVAALPPPKNPYSGESDQNYLYEQACSRYASEHSAQYENPIVQSKMFHTFYTECLASIWPGCEVMNAKGLLVIYPPYQTFSANDVITYDMNDKPSNRAHKSGFLVERLLELGNRWFIFWDSSQPKTDIERFNKIKFTSIKDLYNSYLKNLTSFIKKFQNAGIEESPDKIYIVERLPTGKHRRPMRFNRFKFIIEEVLAILNNLFPKLVSGSVEDLEYFLDNCLPTSIGRMYLFSKHFPEQRIHLCYPLHAIIKTDFPIAIHYMSSGMRPIIYSYNPKYRSFIAALFDEWGNFVKDPKKDFTSYLVISFESIKLE